MQREPGPAHSMPNRMENEPAEAVAGSSDPGWRSLYDYGLIGNQRTCALVSRDGSIDWACLPRFDSPSVFGRLLDRRVGGFHQLTPKNTFASYQQYVGGTNVLSTLFELRRGLVLTLTDFMPVGPSVVAPEGEPRIIRRMTSRGGPIDVTISVDPRFVLPNGRCPGRWRGVSHEPNRDPTGSP